MTAGPALERDNIAGYNCSYIPIIDIRCFDEIMYILMCGTGVGYSVERQYVSRLPDVAETLHETGSTIHVADSKTGWAAAFRQLISLLYAGQIPKWDTSKIRPAGARLKTFGGRASGPGPLEELFTFTVSLFKKAAGRKLNSVEVSDLVCKTAEVVVVGGVEPKKY
jgi:ribonucleoside-diphosphate reductase alpha chain